MCRTIGAWSGCDCQFTIVLKRKFFPHQMCLADYHCLWDYLAYFTENCQSLVCVKVSTGIVLLGKDILCFYLPAGTRLGPFILRKGRGSQD